MLIDCDTCTVRGPGCDDCVVTVLLGAPPGWRGSDPTVVPLTRRGAAVAVTDVADDRAEASGDAPGHITAGGDVPRIDSATADARTVVEFDDVERRAVRALAEFGLVPPLRHQDASTTGDRHVS
ncbi:MAG TPA: hypothetical protein VGO95_13880 [Modestobacter sp.]|nr:hypothetical protein [Modestobacter sp.]